MQLGRRLYGGPKHLRGSSRPTPDPLWMHPELRRPGVTLELLHLEYLREHPEGRFVVSEWKRALVNVDYHVKLADHFYSVPYTLVRYEVEARLTPSTVEIFHSGAPPVLWTPPVA